MFWRKGLELASITLWASTCLPSSQTRVTSAKSFSSLRFPNEPMTLSLKSFHCKQSFSDIMRQWKSQWSTDLYEWQYWEFGTLLVSNLDEFAQRKKSATISFGSEFIAMKQCCEYIRGLRYKLRMMGIPVEGPTYFLVITNLFSRLSIDREALEKFHGMSRRTSRLFDGKW